MKQGRKTQNPNREKLTDGQKWVEALRSLRTEELWVWRAPILQGVIAAQPPTTAAVVGGWTQGTQVSGVFRENRFLMEQLDFQYLCAS